MSTDKTPEIVFKTWTRRPGFGPGHERITVYEAPDGTLCPPTPDPPHGRYVQCAVDRIPFTMKEKDLLERYERQS